MNHNQKELFGKSFVFAGSCAIAAWIAFVAAYFTGPSFRGSLIAAAIGLVAAVAFAYRPYRKELAILGTDPSRYDTSRPPFQKIGSIRGIGIGIMFVPTALYQAGAFPHEGMTILTTVCALVCWYLFTETNFPKHWTTLIGGYLFMEAVTVITISLAFGHQQWYGIPATFGLIAAISVVVCLLYYLPRWGLYARVRMLTHGAHKKGTGTLEQRFNTFHKYRVQFIIAVFVTTLPMIMLPVPSSVIWWLLSAMGVQLGLLVLIRLRKRPLERYYETAADYERLVGVKNKRTVQLKSYGYRFFWGSGIAYLIQPGAAQDVHYAYGAIAIGSVALVMATYFFEIHLLDD